MECLASVGRRPGINVAMRSNLVLEHTSVELLIFTEHYRPGAVGVPAVGYGRRQKENDGGLESAPMIVRSVRFQEATRVAEGARPVRKMLYALLKKLGDDATKPAGPTLPPRPRPRAGPPTAPGR